MNIQNEKEMIIHLNNLLSKNSINNPIDLSATKLPNLILIKVKSLHKENKIVLIISNRFGQLVDDTSIPYIFNDSNLSTQGFYLRVAKYIDMYVKAFLESHGFTILGTLQTKRETVIIALENECDRFNPRKEAYLDIESDPTKAE